MKKSNITDNDSAKMPSSKGVIQGYDGLAMVDGKHHHRARPGLWRRPEHGLLIPMIEGTRANFAEFSDLDAFEDAAVLADAGFCSEKNAGYLHDQQIDGYIADPQFRKRDPRFKDAEHHKPTGEYEPDAKPKKDRLFQLRMFANTGSTMPKRRL